MPDFTVTATVPSAPPPPGTSSVTLSANSLTGIAPFAPQMLAEILWPGEAKPELDLYTHWDFGDPGSTYSRLVGRNHPHGVSAEEEYGPASTHCYFPTAADFAAAGSSTIDYTATFTVSDGDTQLTDTITFTITDPDVAFAGTATILVSPTLEASALYPSAQVVATPDAARTARNNSGPNRILFECGVDHGEWPNLGWDGTDLHLGNYVGANGTDLPILRRRCRISDQQSPGHTAIWGIRILWNYDPTAPEPGMIATDEHAIELNGKYETGYYTTIYNCEMKGHFQGVSPDGQRANISVVNCDIGDWWDSGFFQGNSSWIMFAGTIVAQNRLAINSANDLTTPGGPATGKKTNEYPRHGPSRCSRVVNGGPMVCVHCDIASFNDWNAKATNFAIQPTLRWNSGGDPSDPLVVVMRNRMVGHGLSFPITNSYSDAWGMRGVLAMNYHILWTGGSGDHMGTSFMGNRFYANISVQFDSEWASESIFQKGNGGYKGDDGFGSVWEIHCGYPDANGTIQYRCDWVSNTIIKLATAGVSGIDPIAKPLDLLNIQNLAGTYPAGQTTWNADALSAENNLIYAPLWSETPSVDTSTLMGDFPSRPITAMSLANIAEFGSGGDTSKEVPLSALAFYRPTAATPIDSGQKCSIYDFFGNIRKGYALGSDPSGTPDKGALDYEG